LSYVNGISLEESKRAGTWLCSKSNRGFIEIVAKENIDGEVPP
jgi:hypothetical protein